MSKKSAKSTTKRKPRKIPTDFEAKLFAFLSVFFVIIGFIIAIIAKKDDKYVMFYAKQGLVIFVFALAIEALDYLVDLTPIPFFFVDDILYILLFVLWIITWVYSFSGQMKNTIVIGELAKKINF